MGNAIAIIPARGGSKRIKNKNIVKFCGKPLIEYSLHNAELSGVFDKIHVSTDCCEIAEVVDKLGYTVDFMRPADLADDYTPLMPVLNYVIESYKKLGKFYTDIGLVTATSPLITPDDLSKGYNLFLENSKRSLLSVAKYSAPVEWAFRMRPNSRLEPVDGTKFATRSQDLESYYYDTGSFAFFEDKTILASEGAGNYNNFIGLEIDQYKAIDIDDVDDLAFAEIIFHGLNRK